MKEPCQYRQTPQFEHNLEVCQYEGLNRTNRAELTNIELSSFSRTSRVNSNVLRAKKVLAILDVLGDGEVEALPAVTQPRHSEGVVCICFNAHLIDFKPIPITLVLGYIGDC